MAVNRIRLVHWHQDEATQRASVLEALGYAVDAHVPQGPKFLSEIQRETPDAVVIDLTRLPAQGRDLGLAIRHRKATRRIPLVFVGGHADKVDQVKALLGDATFTHWECIEADLKRAIETPVQDPVAPDSVFAAYRGRPLIEKLGIKSGASVVLVDQPADFRQTLGSLPEGCSVHRSLEQTHDLIIWFVSSQAELEDRIDTLADQVGQAALWIAWPKKGSPIAGDLSQTIVRRLGLASGLVDYKICAIDTTWSALLFTHRKPKP